MVNLIRLIVLVFALGWLLGVDASGCQIHAARFSGWRHSVIVERSVAPVCACPVCVPVMHRHRVIVREPVLMMNGPAIIRDRTVVRPWLFRQVHVER